MPSLLTGTEMSRRLVAVIIIPPEEFTSLLKGLCNERGIKNRIESFLEVL